MPSFFSEGSESGTWAEPARGEALETVTLPFPSPCTLENWHLLQVSDASVNLSAGEPYAVGLLSSRIFI